jgi:hypothetical protein
MSNNNECESCKTNQTNDRDMYGRKIPEGKPPKRDIFGRVIPEPEKEKRDIYGRVLTNQEDD